MIIRGTTPTCNCELYNALGRPVDLSGYSKVIVSISDGTNEIDVEKDVMTFNSDKTFDFKLTQEQTLLLNSYDVDIQIRAIDSSDNAIASDILSVNLEQIIKEGSI